MERVKDLDGLIIQDDSILIKIVEVKSSIILADESKGPVINYSVIQKIGKNIVKYEVGDIILKLPNMPLEVHEYRGEKYALVPEMYIKLAVKPDNFDPYATSLNLAN